MSVIGKVIHTVLDRTKHAVFEKGTLIYRLNIPALRRSNRERTAKTRPEGRVRIGFMLQPPTSWAVIESVYRAAAEDPDLSYLTFIEIRNAIEMLGGVCPEREYDDDPEYEALRQMNLT